MVVMAPIDPQVHPGTMTVFAKRLDDMMTDLVALAGRLAAVELAVARIRDAGDAAEIHRCATCRAWTQELASESPLSRYAAGFGACRRRPPTVVGNQDGEFQTLDWPITGAKDWCCDHLPSGRDHADNP